MKTIGIIVEYNPLHNGHLYHIEKVKKESNADCVIAVLSSSFTMRGDLSLFSKFTKTRQALEASIDLVIELPLVLCMHKADLFASHAVQILNLLNVSEIWIGSEQNSIEAYETYYQELKDQDYTKDMKDGISYKKASSQYLSLESNDILGYCYYKAIKELNYPIKLHTIKRIDSSYQDRIPSSLSIASALAIRSNLDLLDTYTPQFVSKDKNELLDEEMLFPYIKYRILSSTCEELKTIFFVDEGIENTLKKISDFTNLSDFISFLTTKRYTSTRIKRMLIYILCNIKKSEVNEFLNKPITFVRVLGYSKLGRSYLSSIKKNCVIYTNIKEGLHPILDIEFRVSRILDSIYHLNLIKKEQSAAIQ